MAWSIGIDMGIGIDIVSVFGVEVVINAMVQSLECSGGGTLCSELRAWCGEGTLLAVGKSYDKSKCGGSLEPTPPNDASLEHHDADGGAQGGAQCIFSGKGPRCGVPLESESGPDPPNDLGPGIGMDIGP